MDRNEFDKMKSPAGLADRLQQSRLFYILRSPKSYQPLRAGNIHVTAGRSRYSRATPLIGVCKRRTVPSFQCNQMERRNKVSGARNGVPDLLLGGMRQRIDAPPLGLCLSYGFSGCLHLTGTVKQNGVCHIVAFETGSHPCDFVCYEVFQDHLHVQTFTLPSDRPNDLRTEYTDIHGPPRWPTAYTDSTHPTHEA